MPRQAFAGEAFSTVAARLQFSSCRTIDGVLGAVRDRIHVAGSAAHRIAGGERKDAMIKAAVMIFWTIDYSSCLMAVKRGFSKALHSGCAIFRLAANRLQTATGAEMCGCGS